METKMIDISDLDKGSVLAALYNASRPLGMGFMQFDPKPMTTDEATELLKHTNYFDYLRGRGRVMKVGIEGNSLDPWGYDPDTIVGPICDILRDSDHVQAMMRAKPKLPLGISPITMQVGGLPGCNLTHQRVEPEPSPLVSLLAMLQKEANDCQRIATDCPANVTVYYRERAEQFQVWSTALQESL